MGHGASQLIGEHTGLVCISTDRGTWVLCASQLILYCKIDLSAHAPELC